MSWLSKMILNVQGAGVKARPIAKIIANTRDNEIDSESNSDHEVKLLALEHIRVLKTRSFLVILKTLIIKSLKFKINSYL